MSQNYHNIATLTDTKLATTMSFGTQPYSARCHNNPGTFVNLASQTSVWMPRGSQTSKTVMPSFHKIGWGFCYISASDHNFPKACYESVLFLFLGCFVGSVLYGFLSGFLLFTRRRSVLFPCLLTCSEFVDSFWIDAVDVTLVQEDQEDNVWKRGKHPLSRQTHSTAKIQVFFDQETRQIQVMRTVSEASESIERWHFDDEGEQIVDEGVQSLIRQHPPRKMRNGLEFVVDEQLWSHHDETWRNNAFVSVHVDIEPSGKEISLPLPFVQSQEI